MKRKQFITGISMAALGTMVAPNIILGQENRPASYQKEVVRKFVGAGHGKLNVVKELLAEFPNLIYSSWDWGGGDFETAIGAAGHVGYKDMANLLLDKGARPTLHVLTMLGKTNLVKPILNEYPQLINSLGPHGFTFLHHAQKGGADSEELYKYFSEKGQKESQVKLY